MFHNKMTKTEIHRIQRLLLVKDLKSTIVNRVFQAVDVRSLKNYADNPFKGEG